MSFLFSDWSQVFGHGRMNGTVWRINKERWVINWLTGIWVKNFVSLKQRKLIFERKWFWEWYFFWITGWKICQLRHTFDKISSWLFVFNQFSRCEALFFGVLPASSLRISIAIFSNHFLTSKFQNFAYFIISAKLPNSWQSFKWSFISHTFTPSSPQKSHSTCLKLQTLLCETSFNRILTFPQSQGIL